MFEFCKSLLEELAKKKKPRTVEEIVSDARVRQDTQQVPEPQQSDIEKIARNLKPGNLTENTDWVHIEAVGNFLSAKGDDRRHTIVLIEENHGENITIAKIPCSNFIYSEWVSACCNSMFHFKNKTLIDVHGRPHFVGKLCSVRCFIKY